MDRRVAGMAFAGALAVSGLTYAAAPFPYQGEWTLNVDQSKYPPGFPSIRDHHMQVIKDDGESLQYTDNFIVGDQPPAHVSFDGAYDGKPHKTSDGQLMAYFHTATGYRDQYVAPNGVTGEDSCDFSADGMHMTCHGRFTPPGAKQPVTFVEVWDKTK